jgi:hypothetical protein
MQAGYDETVTKTAVAPSPCTDIHVTRPVTKAATHRAAWFLAQLPSR